MGDATDRTATAVGDGPAPTRDLLLTGAAVGAIAIALGSAAAEPLLGAPSPLVVVLVLAALSLALRIVLTLRARRSPVLADRRLVRVVALVLFAISVVLAVGTVGLGLRHDPLPTFGTDLLLHAVTLLTLLVIAIPARTIGWRPLIGMLICGLLAVSSLARAVGVPGLAALGSDVGSWSWVPLTEEVLKAAPVLLVALLAVRDPRRRPSAVDMALLGAASGTGFALIENMDYDRVLGGWDVVPPISSVLPTIDHGFTTAAGHTLWSALTGLGIGVAVLYGRRVPPARLALPIALAVAILEHGLSNADQPPGPLVALTLGGRLSVILLIGGLVVLAAVERAPWRGSAGVRDAVLVRPASTGPHRARLAMRQRSRRDRAAPAVETDASESARSVPAGGPR